MASFRAKFIEQQTAKDFEYEQTMSEVVFLGITKELLVDTKGTPLENTQVNGQRFFFSHDVSDGHDYIFGTEVVKPRKKESNTLPIDPTLNCAGQFCHYFENLAKDRDGYSSSYLPKNFQSHT